MFKTCRFCGNTYFTTRSDSLYCSNRCKNIVWRDQKRRQKTLDGEATARLTELILSYPKLGKPLRTQLRLYGAGAVHLTMRCLEVVEANDYHVSG